MFVDKISHFLEIYFPLMYVWIVSIFFNLTNRSLLKNVFSFTSIWWSNFVRVGFTFFLGQCIYVYMLCKKNMDPRSWNWAMDLQKKILWKDLTVQEDLTDHFFSYWNIHCSINILSGIPCTLVEGVSIPWLNCKIDLLLVCMFYAYLGPGLREGARHD